MSILADFSPLVEPVSVDEAFVDLSGTESLFGSPLAAVRARYAELPDARLISIAGGMHDALNDATHRTAAAQVVLFLEELRGNRSRLEAI